jgi:phosphoserine phosphatase RsbU/P
MTEKMLVVDDEPDLESLIRQRFRRKIRDGEYDFVFAQNGLEALARILEHKDIGLVLSDINMPEMDGLTLLVKLNELKNPAMRTVIVSAYGDMDNIRTAMNRGAYDFVTKPVDFNDLEKTIEKTIAELKSIRTAVREHDRLMIIQYDLDTARSIQFGILPKKFPPFPERNEFEIFASMQPAKEVGGDLYDFFLLDRDRVGFVIGDVSGKGVPAAIFMAVSRTLMRATALKGLEPDDCLTYVNSLLFQESVSSMFVTMFYGILNYKTGELTYANGGHCLPYVLSKSGDLKVLESTGMVLGILDDRKYGCKRLQLNPGDTCFTFTDGVTEAMNPEEQFYGEQRLEQLLRDKGGLDTTSMVKECFADVHNFINGAEQADDITVLSIKLNER